MFQKAFKQTSKKGISAEGHITDTKIAKVLDVLVDGNWHMKEEILEKTGLKPEHLETIIKFLEDYGFIGVDAEKSLVKLDENFRKLFQKASQ